MVSAEQQHKASVADAVKPGEARAERYDFVQVDRLQPSSRREAWRVTCRMVRLCTGGPITA